MIWLLGGALFGAVIWLGHLHNQLTAAGRQLALLAVKQHRVISPRDLANMTGISFSVATYLLEELVKEGMMQLMQGGMYIETNAAKALPPWKL